MTDLDLDALEAVARASTHQESWKVTDLRDAPDGHRDCIWIDTDDVATYATVAEMNDEDGLFPLWGIEDATHIAAFDPPTVLALIAKLREAEAVIERVRSMLPGSRTFAESLPRDFAGNLWPRTIDADDVAAIFATYKPTNQENGRES